MTAIAALIDNGKIWVGGDSAGVDCDSLCLTVRKDEKVFLKDQFIIGFTSSFRMGSLLRYSFRSPRHKDNMSNEEYMNTVFVDAVRDCFKLGGYIMVKDAQENGGTFIVGYRGTIYTIESDFQVAIPVDDYMSCGCGSQICLGSLYSTYGKDPHERIRIALESAERFSAGVRGPFVIKCL